MLSRRGRRDRRIRQTARLPGSAVLIANVRLPVQGNKRVQRGDEQATHQHKQPPPPRPAHALAPVSISTMARALPRALPVCAAALLVSTRASSSNPGASRRSAVQVNERQDPVAGASPPSASGVPVSSRYNNSSAATQPTRKRKTMQQRSGCPFQVRSHGLERNVGL